MKRRLLALLLCVALLLCGGCAELEQAVADAFTEPVLVGFSSPEDATRLIFQDAADLEDYHSIYHVYATETYYDLLDETGKRVYRLLEYALDHGCTQILFSDPLIADLEYPVGSVLTFLALDSPLVEQNLLKQERDFSAVGEKKVGFFTFETTISGTLFTVDTFAAERLERKKEALAKAQAIVDALPEGLTAMERAERLYRTLRETVRYQTYDDPDTANYLYDALVTGATHCDGFANAYSLLCNMAGVTCFEKLYLPEDEEESGHTWNCFCVDGVWYNADASVDSQDLDTLESLTGCLFWFAFTDAFQEHDAYLTDYLPACTTDYLPVDFIVSAYDDVVRQILLVFRSKNHAYFALTDAPIDEKTWQRVSNALRANISWALLDGGRYYRYVVVKR